MRRVTSIVAALVLAGALAGGCTPKAAPSTEAPAGIEISKAWAAATPGGAAVGAGYMVVLNHGAADDRLLSASSPRAAHVEIHDMAMQGDMMTMHPMEAGLAVPAGGSAELKQGGGHLMFIDITAPFVAGETIPVTLTFEKAGAVEASLPVKPLGSGN